MHTKEKHRRQAGQRYLWLALPACLLSSSPTGSVAEPVSSANLLIYGGRKTKKCYWPSVVSMQGECSGTLIHPRLVLYAAHCGDEIEEAWFGESIFEPSRKVAIEHCQTMPNGTPGEGTDLAFCVLAAPQRDIPLVPIASAAEVQVLTQGGSVTLVGFGMDENYVAGFKREVTTDLGETTPYNEVSIGGDGRDACAGDSGGPALIRLPAALSPERSWRAFGVASHGKHCGTGGYYTLIHPHIDWLEAASGLSLIAGRPLSRSDPERNSASACKSRDSAPASPEWTSGCAEATSSTNQQGCVGRDAGPP